MFLPLLQERHPFRKWTLKDKIMFIHDEEENLRLQQSVQPAGEQVSWLFNQNIQSRS